LKQVLEQEALKQHSSSSGRITTDPFVVPIKIFTHFSIAMEKEREALDEQVCACEAVSGVTLGHFVSSRYASIKDSTLRKKALHKLDAQCHVFLRMLEFQVELGKFLMQQHIKLGQLISEVSSETAVEATSDGKGYHGLSMASFHGVEASLELSLSMSVSRLSQVKVLSQRIQIQIQVVCLH
jgi:hypothetical protein